MTIDSDVLELEDRDSSFQITVGIATKQVNILVSLLFLLLLPFAAIFLISFNITTIIGLFISDEKIRKILDDPSASLPEITHLIGNRIGDERYCELMNENYFSVIFCQEYRTIEYIQVESKPVNTKKKK